MRLIFDRPAHYSINVNGAKVHGGEIFDVEDYRGGRLLELFAPVLREATPQDEIASASDPLVVADALGALSRKELHAVAESAGIPEPAKLPNKEAVIDAITQAAAVAASESTPAPDLTVQVPIGADGSGWVEVPGPASAILGPISSEGTVTVASATDNPENACVTVSDATPDSTATVTYTLAPAAPAA